MFETLNVILFFKVTFGLLFVDVLGAVFFVVAELLQ